jgi:hypothetical protein
MARPTGFRSLRPSVDGNGEVLGEPGATVVGQPDRARARQPRDPFELEHPRPGRATLTVALNQRTRDAIRRTNVLLTVRITVIDGAGNRSRQTRVLRSQTLGQRRG